MDNRYIFIVGMARTGTTLIARCLNAGKDAYILNETHLIRESRLFLSSDEKLDDPEFVLKAINKFFTIQKKGIYRKTEYQEYPDDAAVILKEFNKIKDKNYKDLICTLFNFEAFVRNKNRAGDQTPNHVFHIDFLLNLFPESIFVNMVRDPRAVVLSQKKKWKAAKKKEQPLFEIIRTRINYHPITQAILWDRSITAALKAIEKFGKGKIKTVHYEDFVNCPEKQLKAICEFAEIEYTPNMVAVPVSMSSNTSKDISGIDSTLADKWKKGLSFTEIFIVDLLSNNQAMRLGYQSLEVTPNLPLLIGYLLIFPIHVLFAFCFSAGRIKNSFIFFQKFFSNF